MKKKYVKKLFIIAILIILLIIICMPKSLAVKPSDITGEVEGGDSLDLSFVAKLANILRTIGIFLAVGVMMVIGIKYMSGSIEEKAQYKKTMMPYLIGCVFLFGASIIAPQIIEVFKNTNEVEDAGNIALGIVQVIGSVTAVGVLMVLGIKYMLGSVEQRASYKKSMLPYFIGSILLFGSVNITNSIYKMISDSNASGEFSTSNAIADSAAYIESHTTDEIRAERTRALNKLNNAIGEEEKRYWQMYADNLRGRINGKI